MKDAGNTLRATATKCSIRRHQLAVGLGLLVAACTFYSTQNSKGLLVHTFLVAKEKEAAGNEIIATSWTPPKWPQKDDRLRRAILTGIRLEAPENSTHANTTSEMVHYQHNNILYEAPTPRLATLVTALYDLPSKHSRDEYRTWFTNLLECTDPMVIFLDPHSAWPQFVMDRRQHAPTLIVQLPFVNLTMATRFSKVFWENEVIPLDGNSHLYNATLVYTIWNEKIIMMHETSKINPFDTELIFWIDAGYFRTAEFSPTHRPLVRNNVTANGVDPEKVLLYKVIIEQIAGGSFGGRMEAMRLFYDRYFETFWFMAISKIMCIGYEQRVLTLMCRSFPEICVVHDANGEWFQLGERLLPSGDHKWDAVPYPPSDDLLVTLPVVLPTDEVIYNSEVRSAVKNDTDV